MSDIFISYSRQDAEQAQLLTELLTSAGLSVWIDKSGIDLATSWSKEIVQAIDQCSAFVVLLSAASNDSTNVHKEVSLASEKKKKILPLDLEPVALSEDLQYALAGLQRASMTNIDAIIRALGKLGLEATQAPTLKLIKETDSRKSLMILPFEDLSPTADNAWFADGLATELISALSNVKALRVTDQQTTKEYKGYKGHLTTYAKEMSIRYFIQGSVRKFGDQIKITSALLDIETGDHLWQDSMKGMMNDIFDIQEKVAEKVVEGLKVHLASDEKKKLAERGTENAEAYELYLKGKEYYDRSTRADLERALGLYGAAVRLDPGFAWAHLSIASTSLEYHRTYSSDSSRLAIAEEHIEKAQSVLGTSKEIYSIRSNLALNQGDPEEALHLAERSAELGSEYDLAYDALGFAYKALGRKAEAAEARMRYVQLRENNRQAHFNYLISLNELGDTARLAEAARNAGPTYERHLRLTPDDLHARVEYANVLRYAGEHEGALSEAEKLELAEGMDGAALYNLACLYLHERDSAGGMRTLWKSARRGFRDIETFRRDPDLDPLREPSSPFHLELKELLKEMEDKTHA